MIEIEMSKDVRDFEPKIIGPLSVRQLVCVGVGVVCAFPVLAWLPISLEMRMLIAVFIAAPAVACGFLKLYGMHAEAFFVKVLIPQVLQKKQRPYKTENSMGVLLIDEDKVSPKKIHYSREYRPKE